ncbi:MAG: PLP-dependent transferase [Rhodospirillaceae bacterium]|nr:MAG: PLP-dependent transferase [Rhodospirillaceae bacterium]
MIMKQPKASWTPATLAAQAMGSVDATTRAIIPPIHPATTFQRDSDNQYRAGWSYTRYDNPTYQAAEELMTQLEGGAGSMIFASGMAAAVCTFTGLKPGDHVIVPQLMYWALRSWLMGPALDWGLDVTLVDMTDLAAVAAALRPNKTKLVWIETPANPLWRVTDIAAVAKLAHDAGARVVVDSTCATPVLSRPIEHGADLVMHSATKYLNGHSDVLAGSLTTARCDSFWDKLKSLRPQIGGVPGPFEAWLLQRGMRTLFLRVRQASQSAARIAAHFAEHPAIAGVLYPGLPNHPDHAIACRQMQGGFGGMLSLRLAGNSAEAGLKAAVDCAARVKLWKRATSLGGVESLIEHRASIEGPQSPVPGDLLRLSVGIEDPDDLIADLEAALV